MIPTRHLPLSALLLVAISGGVGSCTSKADFSVAICGYLDADGVFVRPQPPADTCASIPSVAVPNDDGTLTVDSTNVQLRAVVKARKGTWRATASASGALSTGGEGVSRAFESDGSSETNVYFPVSVVQPGGPATVTVAVGDNVEEFSFNVAPTSKQSSSVCIADLSSGGSDTTAPGCGDPLTTFRDDCGLSADGNVRTICVPQPAQPYFQGERVFLLAKTNDSLDDGSTRTGTLTSTGSLSLLVDGKAVNATAIQLTNGQSSALVPAQFISPGSSTVTLQFGHGPAVGRAYESGSPFVVARRVEFIGKTGGQSRNIVTVCTSMLQGNLTASIPSDAGTITTPTAAIASADPEICPAQLSLAGQASFVWTGSTSKVAWQFSLGDGGLITQAVQMINGSSTSTPSCLELSGEPEVLAWAELPAPVEPPVDGGTSDAATAPGHLTVNARVALVDCSIPNALKIFEGTVAVQGTGGLVPTASSATADSAGRVVFELTGPALLDTATALLTTPNGGSLPVPVNKPSN
ncbi:MAG TPA: hypothetical protein VER96_07875 [Polyangiaceae bacterium]|nr:hypothetical protein [Polyangiaceae bacterium]